MFSSVCAEVTWACWSPSRMYFLSCFQLAHHFPSLPFSPSSPFFLSCPKASLCCPQERKNYSLHRDKESQMALLEPGHLRAELTLLFWVDEAALFSISLVWCCHGARKQTQRSRSPPLPPIIMIFHLLVLSMQERFLIASCVYESMSWHAVGLLPSKRNLMFVSDELRARNLCCSDLFIW